MSNIIYYTYMEVINKLKANENTKSIILVGSSKDKNLKDDDCKVNDIDIFVIVKKQEKDQIRDIKTINNIEFDINYISIEGSYDFINKKTYFFLKIKDGKLIYDEEKIGETIMRLCKDKYNEGPNKLSIVDKNFKANQLKSDILRLANKNNYDDFEYDFLINLYLIETIKLYYIVSDKWLPKDKKLLKSLKMDNQNLYESVKKVQGVNKYENLLRLLDYIWSRL